MNENNNIFINKKILIYGIGRSGISALKFLKRYSNISLFDDDKKIKVSKTISSKIITYSEILKSKFWNFEIYFWNFGILNFRC